MHEVPTLDRATRHLPAQWLAPALRRPEPARSARRLAATLARHRRLRAPR